MYFLNKKTHKLFIELLIAKVSEFIGIENNEILAIQKALNNRPGKVLNYRIPTRLKTFRCCTSWLNGAKKGSYYIAKASVSELSFK